MERVEEEKKENLEETAEKPVMKSDEEVIDFSTFKNLFKKKKKAAKHEEQPIQPLPHEKEKIIEAPSDDSETISLSALKEKSKSFFKKENRRKGSHQSAGDHEGPSFNFDSVKGFARKNQKWLIPVALIFLAMLVSFHFRMMPSDLPITEDWAQSTVYNYYQNNMQSQVNQQYPNLPQQNRDALVNTEFQKFLTDNADSVQQQIDQVSQEFKGQFQDENGDTYLLAIDPYLWYSEMRNVINYGHLGDKIIDGESYFSLRDGRLDKKASFQLHPYIAAYFYKFMSVFDRDISLMRALFLLPAVLIALALIPIFFIGRRLAGNVGGFFAAILLAINGPLLGRTPAGFADTDPYNILFPLLIIWLFIEAFYARDLKKKIAYLAGSGLFVGAFAVTWSGWTYVELIIAGIFGAWLLIRVAIDYYKERNEKKWWKKVATDLKAPFFTFIGFLVSSGIFAALFGRFTQFYGALSRTISFTNIKEVGIKTIWPNVLTTVAEFNTTSFSNIVDQMGGKPLFTLAVLGALLLLVKRVGEEKRNYFDFIMLAVWFTATAYAFTKGTRFAILMAPPFALAIGAFSGRIYYKGSLMVKENINLDRRIAKGLAILLICLFLITPFASAKQVAITEVPSMNDAWYTALTKIRDDTPDSIITSWWDFGHWFVAIGQRRVTFDGGDQGERIHWVGRTLLSDNEAESVGILRMLNCVQETAPHKLDEYTHDSLKSIQMLYQVFPISSRSQALQKYQELGLTKEQAEVMIEYTHCQDLLPNYYITSDDMVGKAGVWGHFGSWDFEKSTMFQTTKKMSREDAVKYLMEKFGMTEEQAHKTHGEIQAASGDQWIAPWPGYLTSPRACEKLSENEISCQAQSNGGIIPLKINIDTMTVTVEGNDEVTVNSLVYPTPSGVQVKEFEGEKVGASVVLIPNGERYNFLLADPLQAKSMFTKLFFLNGEGSKCFQKFDERNLVTGGAIMTWKVDYSCSQGNIVQ
ncbi:hypothetical protein COV20_03760 [Candidatus Woesearchaeota archaeon CG10_big_fil_rev_8_21_14_0_10_45_16]|nr:MAG: hypothetical protein COV20_03760 [Candidatus Woesearchaeota archaeon CG10_big_fil_rev_8_21_14_0_10_45_16]